MGADSLPTSSGPEHSIRIDPAEDEDWAWIIPRQVETAWASLSPARREAASRQVLENQIAAQVATLTQPEPPAACVLVARTDPGRRAGFVWVEQVTSGFTGKPQAHLVGLFVEGDFRRRGLGRALLVAAEQWAHRQGLERIQLHVAAHSQAAFRLYEALGFTTETLRMAKAIRG